MVKVVTRIHPAVLFVHVMASIATSPSFAVFESLIRIILAVPDKLLVMRLCEETKVRGLMLIFHNAGCPKKQSKCIELLHLSCFKLFENSFLSLRNE